MNLRALLTSSGIKNSSIHDALTYLLDKPIPRRLLAQTFDSRTRFLVK